MAGGQGIVDQAARGFVSTLMEGFARARGKARWAEKTPDNALYVDLEHSLAVDAFVHAAKTAGRKKARAK